MQQQMKKSMPCKSKHNVLFRDIVCAYFLGVAEDAVKEVQGRGFDGAPQGYPRVAEEVLLEIPNICFHTASFAMNHGNNPACFLSTLFLDQHVIPVALRRFYHSNCASAIEDMIDTKANMGSSEDIIDGAKGMLLKAFLQNVIQRFVSALERMLDLEVSEPQELQGLPETEGYIGKQISLREIVEQDLL